MSKEELKLNDKELHKCIDELKGTQFLSAFYILDWIIKMRNENKELQERINKAIEYINKDYSVMEAHEIIRLEEILRGGSNE